MGRDTDVIVDVEAEGLPHIGDRNTTVGDLVAEGGV
jgi:hypothetical protein